MFLLDRFFDGTFFTYGIEVMSFADRDQEDRIDPIIYVFPRYSNIYLWCQHKSGCNKSLWYIYFLQSLHWTRNFWSKHKVVIIIECDFSFFSPCVQCTQCIPFRMTKCTFHKFGTSGNIEKHDALCILPLNIGKVCQALHLTVYFWSNLFYFI